MVQASAALAGSAEQSTQHEVWQAILGLVRRHGLTSGDKLPSLRELAESLQVKPGMVREALLQAQAQGAVRIVPRAGVFLEPPAAEPVSQTSVAEPKCHDLAPPLGSAAPKLESAEPNLLHVLDARRLVETELAGRAAERRRLEDLVPVRRTLEAMLNLPDSDPHVAFTEHDIRFHVEIARLAGNPVLFGVQQSLMETLRPHLLAIEFIQDRRSRADASHSAIYAALVAGDAVRIRALVEEHIGAAYDSLLRDLRELPVRESPVRELPVPVREAHRDRKRTPAKS